MPVTTTDCSLAAAALREGRLVAFATETVYGLGAAAANRQAVGALYQCKRRPRNHPVIVHLSDFSLATRWVRMIPAAAYRLAEAFMPGPLTLLLPAADGTEHLTGGSDSLAIRSARSSFGPRVVAVLRRRGRRSLGQSFRAS